MLTDMDMGQAHGSSLFQLCSDGKRARLPSSTSLFQMGTSAP